MPKAKQRAIARKCGTIAHMTGKAHTWTKEEASAAGRIGGRNIYENPAFLKRKERIQAVHD